MVELNMDGLVGPSHHYAGLAEGNIASIHNAQQTSNPQAAALEGLAKMRFLHHAGLKQALLPPHQRPNFALLAQLGFKGKPLQQIQHAFKTSPELLSVCYSASSMWAANAATVSASIDTTDHRVHFTAANLITHLHRYQEADFTHRLFEKIFHDPHYFFHHAILPRSQALSDEGAANYNRLCANHQNTGIHLFVYGKQGIHQSPGSKAIHFPARQSLEASQIIVRNHGLNPALTWFACQNPNVIDQGVFHNDVISVANECVFLTHETAFLNQKKIFAAIQEKADFTLHWIEIPEALLTVSEAVSTYLFNSQLLTISSEHEKKKMLLLAPIECQKSSRVSSLIDNLMTDSSNPIEQVHYVNLRQSMRNGGGPACLRLRILLNEQELQAMHQGVLINETLLQALEAWIKRHYRTHLHANDLADPLLVEEIFSALDELTKILQLGPIYPFQQE